MRRLIPLAAFLFVPSVLVSQEHQSKPYTKGDVDEFLQQARAKGRPAIVLFNFDRESG